MIAILLKAERMLVFGAKSVEVLEKGQALQGITGKNVGLYSLKKFFCLSLFIFERQREIEHKQKKGREKRKHRLKQTLGSELSAQSWTRVGRGVSMNHQIMS